MRANIQETARCTCSRGHVLNYCTAVTAAEVRPDELQKRPNKLLRFSAEMGLQPKRAQYGQRTVVTAVWLPVQTLQCKLYTYITALCEAIRTLSRPGAAEHYS